MPFRLKKGYPHWIVPPIEMTLESIDTKKNPFYRKNQIDLFLWRDEQGVAQARAAIIRKEGESEKAHFGFLEFSNSAVALDSLLTGIREELKALKIREIIGPYSPSINYESGILVEGFDDTPSIMTPYHPKYYGEHMARAGFKKLKDLLAYDLKSSGTFQARVFNKSTALKASGRVKLRPLRLSRFEEEVKVIYDLYHQAWEKNWGFERMSEKEFRAMAFSFKPILDPRFALIAEVDGKPAGFALGLPDINPAFGLLKNGRLFPFGWLKLLAVTKTPLRTRYINRVRVIALGIVPEYRPQGLGPILYEEFLTRAREAGYERGEASWILEDNVSMNRALTDMNAQVSKKYRIWSFDVNQSLS